MTKMNSNDQCAEDSEKFVAFFDIMGFKDYVYSHSHSSVVDRIESLSNFIEATTIPIELPNKKIPPLSEYLKTLLVSDSMIMCSKSNTKEDFVYILLAATSLITGCLKHEIPIKGAISYGLFTCDTKRSIYAGKPLINASLIESSLEFYGCVLDHCVEKRIEFLKAEDFYQKFPRLKVPTKDGDINYHTAKIEVDNVDNILNKFYKTVSGRPRKYIDNSITLYNNELMKTMDIGASIE